MYDNRRHPDLPVPLSKFFLERALLWLEIELDSPRVATIQGLIILSNIMAASTKDTRGWVYSGKELFVNIIIQSPANHICNQVYQYVLQ